MTFGEVPNLPRVSQVPQRTSGCAGRARAPDSATAKAPQVVLYIGPIMRGQRDVVGDGSTTSPPLAPIWPTILSCRLVRLGMWSRSMPMGCNSTALDLPPFERFYLYRQRGHSRHASFQHAQPASHAGRHDGKPGSRGSPRRWQLLESRSRPTMDFATQGEWGWTNRTVSRFSLQPGKTRAAALASARLGQQS